MVFICGSLEPGRDGVGDYTRRLAQELHAGGQHSLIVSTHDKKAPAPVREGQSGGSGPVIPVYRLPRALDDQQRFELLGAFLQKHDPRLVSLQYVPYSFHARGIPGRFLSRLAAVLRDYRVEVMVHETWITPARAKNKLTASIIRHLQRRAIRRILVGLRPEVIHTHLPMYAARLEEMGAVVRPLPLFSNIPRVGEPPAPSPAGAVFGLVLFSQVTPRPEVIAAIGETVRRLRDLGKQPKLTIVGGSPKKAAELERKCREQDGDLEIISTGFVSAGEVSRHLAAADLAVSPVPSRALGKSGTVSAFLLHELPILAPVTADHHESFFDSRVSRLVMSTFSEEKYRLAREAFSAIDTVQFTPAAVARTFLTDVTPPG